MDEVEVDVFDTQAFQAGGDSLLDTLVPWVIELGGDPDLLTRNTGVLDAQTDFLLVSVGEGTVDM